MHLSVSSPWHRARKEGTGVPGGHGNIVDTRYGGQQGVGTQKWTAVGEAGFLVCSCLWAQGQGSGPRVGGFVGDTAHSASSCGGWLGGAVQMLLPLQH